MNTPTRSVPMGQFVKVRVTGQDREMLRRAADKQGWSVSTIIRQALIEQGVIKA